jgi:putative oxidoreductase
MQIATLIARILLGMIFLVFGLNGFLTFLHMPPPEGLAAQFIGALFASHYAYFLFALQILASLLLLTNQYVALALAVLAPIIVNILAFHIFMAPTGVPLALLTTILWMVVMTRHLDAFRPLFAQRA